MKNPENKMPRGIPSSTGKTLAVLGIALSMSLVGAKPSATNATGKISQQTSCVAYSGQSDAATPAELDSQLEILSWNIKKASLQGWESDLASFADGVQLAFIQEAARDALLQSMVPAALHSFFATGYTTSSMETGVMTLSAGFPSLRCNLTSQEPWLGTPKATSVTEYPLRDRDDTLLAINLHAVNFAFGVEEFEAQFHALSDLLENHQGPVIFAGDLNTWSERRELLVSEFLGGFGLAAVQFTPDLRTTAFGRPLDHIYVRGMNTDSARVIPVSSSDHNPLRVRFTIN